MFSNQEKNYKLQNENINFLKEKFEEEKNLLKN